MDEELEDTEVDTAELDREWHSRREEFWNTGYREGFDEGKLETVQEGFDKGIYIRTKGEGGEGRL